MSTSPLSSLRTVTLALMLMPLILVVAGYVVLSPTEGAWDTPDLIWLAPLFVLSLGCLGAIAAIGYRAEPVAATTTPADAAAIGVERFRTLTIVRFAAAEGPALLGLGLAFVAEAGGLVLLVAGVAIALLLLIWHVYPNDGQIGKVQASLERKGARVPLREALYGDPLPRA